MIQVARLEQMAIPTLEVLTSEAVGQITGKLEARGSSAEFAGFHGSVCSLATTSVPGRAKETSFHSR
jgi:hypothetical protein